MEGQKCFYCARVSGGGNYDGVEGAWLVVVVVLAAGNGGG